MNFAVIRVGADNCHTLIWTVVSNHCSCPILKNSVTCFLKSSFGFAGFSSAYSRKSNMLILVGREQMFIGEVQFVGFNKVSIHSRETSLVFDSFSGSNRAIYPSFAKEDS